MENGEHPQFRMWRDRLDAEMAEQAARTARRAFRETEREQWYAAWHQYKKHHAMGSNPVVRPRWWNVPGWLLYLMRLHAPGRPG